MAVYHTVMGFFIRVRCIEHASGPVITPPTGSRLSIYCVHGRMADAGDLTFSWDATPTAEVDGLAIPAETGNDRYRYRQTMLIEASPVQMWGWRRKVDRHDFRTSVQSLAYQFRAPHEADVVDHIVDGAWRQWIGVGGSPMWVGGTNESFVIEGDHPWSGTVWARSG